MSTDEQKCLQKGFKNIKPIKLHTKLSNKPSFRNFRRADIWVFLGKWVLKWEWTYTTTNRDKSCLLNGVDWPAWFKDTHLWAHSGTTTPSNYQNRDKREDKAPIYSTKHYSAISTNPQGNQKLRQLSMPYEEFVRRMVDVFITSKFVQNKVQGLQSCWKINKWIRTADCPNSRDPILICLAGLS
jgi:hypothetical protein